MDIKSMEHGIDPSNFLKSNSYGSAPSNTTLTIKYYTGVVFPPM